MASVEAPSGIWRGEITRVEGQSVYLMIPRLGGRREYGPVEIAEFPGSPGLVTADTGGHSHALRNPADVLQIGDRVYVGLVEGNPDDVVVLGRRPR